MKTKNILLDLQFSLPNATREPSPKNVIDPHYLVITGVKYTLVVDLKIDQDEWNDYFVHANEFFIYDADNLPIEDADPSLISKWIHDNILYKAVNDFKESKYKDFNDWKANSPLIELNAIS